MDTITFKRHLVPYVVPDEAVYLVSERGVSAVHGELAAALAPLLDGSHDADAVVGALSGRFEPDRVRRALGQLVRAGRIAFAKREVDRQQAAYWELAGLDGDTVATRLAASPVGLEIHGEVDPVAVISALDVAGLRVAAPGEAAPLTVVVADDYLRPALAERNADALERGE